MKSSLYFGIKLEKRVLLHKLKSYLEKSEEHKKISHKIIINQIKQNSKNKEKNKTKKNA